MVALIRNPLKAGPRDKKPSFAWFLVVGILAMKERVKELLSYL